VGGASGISKVAPISTTVAAGVVTARGIVIEAARFSACELAECWAFETVCEFESGGEGEVVLGSGAVTSSGIDIQEKFFVDGVSGRSVREMVCDFEAEGDLVSASLAAAGTADSDAERPAACGGTLSPPRVPAEWNMERMIAFAVWAFAVCSDEDEGDDAEGVSGSSRMATACGISRRLMMLEKAESGDAESWAEELAIPATSDGPLRVVESDIARVVASVVASVVARDDASAVVSVNAAGVAARFTGGRSACG
jgi:hypothetical protein